MAKQSPGQKKTVDRVLHEFKHGELESAGGKVKSRRQAVAIALSEAGESRKESPARNRRNLTRTKTKERRGETARDVKEGRKAKSGGTNARRKAGGDTRAELYAEARRRDIPGRSGMSKADLEQALKRRAR
jgi:hypothetical protein